VSILKQAIHSLRRLPLRIVVLKIVFRLYREVSSRVSRRRALRSGLGVTEARFSRAVLGGALQKEEWSQDFINHLCEVSLLSGESLAGRLVVGQARLDIISAGEAAVRHEFDLLGSGLTKVHYGLSLDRLDSEGRKDVSELRGRVLAEIHTQIQGAGDYEPIDWHIDFKTGHRWPGHVWHADVRAYHSDGADIKIPWELARGHHLVVLAKACVLTGDVGYATEVRAQIADFIYANKVGFGPNWVCPMDVSIRACNWIVAVSLLARLNLVEPAFAWRLARALQDHGRFIRANLEWSAEVNGNHFAADLVGLFFIGLCCPGLPEAGSWVKFSRHRLEQEVMSQNNPDGSNFEASTCYHRLAFEMFFYAALQARNCDAPMSAEYLARLRAMAEVVRGISFEGGDVPQIGDNDSGRFILADAGRQDGTRMDYLLPLADWVLHGETREYAADVDTSALTFCCGKGLVEMSSAGWHQRGSVLLPDAGWAVLRSAGLECVVACGSNGQGGNGGHGHNDKLSICISIDGDVLLVDPGTYVYTPDPELRNLYRSTGMHSTPQPESREINPILGGKAGLFSLPDHSQATIRHFDGSKVIASHRGFGYLLEMEVKLTGEILVASYHGEDRQYTMRWHLAPGVKAEITGARAVLTGSRGRYLLTAESPVLEGRPYQYSPAYGVRSAALVLHAHVAGSFKWTLERMQA
jgi:Heparinase II/III-like protein/Heparinase II/III N-terminus